MGSSCSLPRRRLSREGLTPEPPPCTAPACPSCSLAAILPAAARECPVPYSGSGQSPTQAPALPTTALAVPGGLGAGCWEPLLTLNPPNFLEPPGLISARIGAGGGGILAAKGWLGNRQPRAARGLLAGAPGAWILALALALNDCVAFSKSLPAPRHVLSHWSVQRVGGGRGYPRALPAKPFGYCAP